MFRYCRSLNHPKSCRAVLGTFKKRFFKDFAVLNTKPFLLHNLQDGPSKTSTLSRKEALHLYNQMYTIRTMEESIKDLILNGHVHGALHLSSGQEAITVGLNAIMRRQDAIITSHRMHSWVYLMGVEFGAIMAEMTGKKSGSAEGKGGSMHLHYSHKLFGGNGIVGDQVPVGAGVALAKQYLGGNGVCIVIYGDGAANQGQVFETFNMAKLWNLPCIFVCENNRYGKFTRIERSSANTKAYTRGDYIPGIWADGMDVLSVKEAGRYAINHCSSGNGPILLELDSYL